MKLTQGTDMTTMKDVAAAAGVSLSTVSYVLSNDRPISQVTRQRVIAAMGELGYTRNAAARALASQRSYVIALVLPTDLNGFGATMGEFVEAVTSTAERAGYTAVVWPFPNDQYAKVDHLVKQGLADGVLVMEVNLDDARITDLEAAHIPYAMIGRTQELAGRPWVDIDFEATVADALDRLAKLGHRHIGLINHSQAAIDADYGPAIKTRDCFLAGDGRDGLALRHIACDETAMAGRAAVARLLDDDPATTALITLNEAATFGVVAELTDRGRPVPGSMSVIGLATSPTITAMTSPSLTSYRSPGHDLGRAATSRLLAVLDGTDPVGGPQLFPCTFAEGDSLAPAAPLGVRR